MWRHGSSKASARPSRLERQTSQGRPSGRRRPPPPFHPATAPAVRASSGARDLGDHRAACVLTGGRPRSTGWSKAGEVVARATVKEWRVVRWPQARGSGAAKSPCPTGRLSPRTRGSHTAASGMVPRRGAPAGDCRTVMRATSWSGGEGIGSSSVTVPARTSRRPPPRRSGCGREAVRPRSHGRGTQGRARS